MELKDFEYHCITCDQPFIIKEGQMIICEKCETFYDRDNNMSHNNFKRGDRVRVWSQKQKKLVDAMFYRKSKLHPQFSVVYIPSDQRETHCIAHETNEHWERENTD